MSRPPGTAVLRGLLTAAVTAAVVLSLLIAGRLVVRRTVMGRLRLHDPEAFASELSLAPGCVILKDVGFPGRGARLDSIVVLLEGSPLSPRASMVSVCGGTVDLRRLRAGGEEAGGAEPGSDPDVVFTNLLLHDGRDSSRCSGRLSGSGSSLLGALRGDWGAAMVSLRRSRQTDSVYLIASGISRIPHVGGGLPVRLQGRRYDSRLSGTLGESGLRLDGRVTAIDGEPVDVPVSLRDEGRGMSAQMTLRLESFGPWMEGRAVSSGLDYAGILPSGTALISVAPDAPVAFSCSLQAEPLRLYDPELCRDTLEMRVHLTCRGSYSPETGLLEVRAGSLTVGEATVFFDLDYRPSPGPRLRVHAWADSLGGRELAASVPDPLLGRLGGLSLGGSAAFSLECVLDWDTPDSCDFVADVDVSRLSVEWSPVRFGRLRDFGATCVMEDSWHNVRTIALDTLSNRGFLPLYDLPAAWEPILLCAEDATFRSHEGFCLYHIRNSIVENVEAGSFRRGGSTLTMQLAKNLFLNREKVLSRKLQEVFLAWRLERYLSKDRMLELYANIVEMGPDVFGVGEAALYYFDIPAESLSVLQTAFLVSVLPGPRIYHRFFVNGTVPDYWRAYLERLVAIAQRKGWLDSRALEMVRGDTLVFRRAEWSPGPGSTWEERPTTRQRYESRLERCLYGASENVDRP